MFAQRIVWPLHKKMYHSTTTYFKHLLQQKPLHKLSLTPRTQSQQQPFFLENLLKQQGFLIGSLCAHVGV